MRYAADTMYQDPRTSAAGSGAGGYGAATDPSFRFTSQDFQGGVGAGGAGVMSSFDHIRVALELRYGACHYYPGFPRIRGHQLYLRRSDFGPYPSVWGKCPAGRRFIAWRWPMVFRWLHTSVTVFETPNGFAPGYGYRFTPVQLSRVQPLGEVNPHDVVRRLSQF